MAETVVKIECNLSADILVYIKAANVGASVRGITETEGRSQYLR